MWEQRVYSFVPCPHLTLKVGRSSSWSLLFKIHGWKVAKPCNNLLLSTPFTQLLEILAVNLDISLFHCWRFVLPQQARQNMPTFQAQQITETGVSFRYLWAGRPWDIAAERLGFPGEEHGLCQQFAVLTRDDEFESGNMWQSKPVRHDGMRWLG